MGAAGGGTPRSVRIGALRSDRTLFHFLASLPFIAVCNPDRRGRPRSSRASSLQSALGYAGRAVGVPRPFRWQRSHWQRIDPREMAQRIAISATAALALAALIVAILALIKDPAPTPALPPSKGEPSAYTHWFVQQALERYDAQGRQATLDFYNSPKALTASGTSSSSKRSMERSTRSRTPRGRSSWEPPACAWTAAALTTAPPARPPPRLVTGSIMCS